MFLNYWVELSADEIHDDDEYALGDVRDARIKEARRSAVEEVYVTAGFSGLLHLSRVGEGGHHVRWFAIEVLASTQNCVNFITVQGSLDNTVPCMDLKAVTSDSVFARPERLLQDQTRSNDEANPTRFGTMISRVDCEFFW